MRNEKQLWFWLAALVLVIAAIALLRDILLPFVAAIVIAYFLSPLADRLQVLGLNRGLAALLIVGIGCVLVAIAVVLLGPLLVEQVRQLVTALPGEMERLKAFLETLGRNWLGPNFPAFQAALDRTLSDFSQNWTAIAGTAMGSSCRH